MRLMLALLSVSSLFLASPSFAIPWTVTGTVGFVQGGGVGAFPGAAIGDDVELRFEVDTGVSPTLFATHTAYSGAVTAFDITLGGTNIASTTLPMFSAIAVFNDRPSSAGRVLDLLTATGNGMNLSIEVQVANLAVPPVDLLSDEMIPTVAPDLGLANNPLIRVEDLLTNDYIEMSLDSFVIGDIDPMNGGGGQTAPIPEPSAALAFGLGCGILAAARRSVAAN